MFPFDGIRLLLPALLPSWRFFDGVSDSPRIDYAILGEGDAQWHEFRPRPAELGVMAMLGRLFWNRQWNEDLFLVSLVERLLNPLSPAALAHSQRELMARVGRHLALHGLAGDGDVVQIRLRLVGRIGQTARLSSHTVYLSTPAPLAQMGWA